MRPDITHGYMGEITPGEKVESWRKERRDYQLKEGSKLLGPIIIEKSDGTWKEHINRLTRISRAESNCLFSFI